MKNWKKHLFAPVSSAPLAVFRIIFGAMMLAGTLRFWLGGRIESQYLEPKFFFKYYGFEFVRPLGEGTYFLFFLIGLSAFFVMLGLIYRASAAVFFLSFSYAELIDLSNYLNHYYFIILVAGIMVFLPANRRFSLDIWRKPGLFSATIPAWCLYILRLQLTFVYFFAGLAKLNSDWLFEARPLRLWLAAKSDIPLIGSALKLTFTAYLFSWFGAFYDLTVPVFLSMKKSRPIAYFSVVVFHLTTSALFPIGMFPYIMILSTLLFFPAQFHEQIIAKMSRFFSSSKQIEYVSGDMKINYKSLTFSILTVFLFIQIILPLRAFAYPGNLLWTEQGYRFSWRVMLTEKGGNTTFYVKKSGSNHRLEVNNSDYLTPFQEKMMSTQADMILQFAHYIVQKYKNKGKGEVEVYTDAFVSFNGRPARRLIRLEVNLAAVRDNFSPKKWLLPFEEKQQQK